MGALERLSPARRSKSTVASPLARGRRARSKGSVRPITDQGEPAEDRLRRLENGISHGLSPSRKSVSAAIHRLTLASALPIVMPGSEWA